MAQSPSLSFEFFPPKTPQGQLKLATTAKRLSQLNPDFYSVTFGAGGSTKSLTPETVEMVAKSQVNTAPHISCLGSTKDEICQLLDFYLTRHINRLVVLRGDKQQNCDETSSFKYASDLVAFIREKYGDAFWLEVACYPEYHPEAQSAEQDFAYFVDKVKAGADSAITQYFYNLDAFEFFLERCQKANLTIPIVPGIMPITQLERLVRFSKGCGADIPQWLRRTLEDYQDSPESLKAFGIDFVSRMCNSLLEKQVGGLHFYTLNDPEASLEICQKLKLKTRESKNISKQVSFA